MGSNSIFELTLSKPHSFIIMTTRTITGRSSRNSRNARSVPGIAFGRTIPHRVSTPRRLPSIPPSESRFEELGSEHGDGNQDGNLGQGGDFGDGIPVTIHLMMMVLVTTKMMKIPMMMKINQTLLM